MECSLAQGGIWRPSTGAKLLSSNRLNGRTLRTLHILGNGFDLAHGLPTSFDPDLRRLAARNERYADEWESYYGFGELWADVEVNLASPDVQVMLEHIGQYAPDYGSDRESDRDSIIFEAEEMLHFPLEEFARHADQALAETAPQERFLKHFSRRDWFLTFNYTHTLERLYGIPRRQILHVHGEVDGAPLILGYAPGSLAGVDALGQWDDEDGFDYYWSTASSTLRERLIGFEKSYQIDKLKAFLRDMKGEVDHISIYGLSCGIVDKPYFLQLHESFPDALWGLGSHGAKSVSDARANFVSYGLGVSPMTFLL